MYMRWTRPYFYQRPGFEFEQRWGFKDKKRTHPKPTQVFGIKYPRGTHIKYPRGSNMKYPRGDDVANLNSVYGVVNLNSVYWDYALIYLQSASKAFTRCSEMYIFTSDVEWRIEIKPVITLQKYGAIIRPGTCLI